MACLTRNRLLGWSTFLNKSEQVRLFSTRFGIVVRHSPIKHL